MGILEILAIALGLSMDAFAVSLAVATAGKAASKRAAFRLAFHFGLFQFLMPIVGWLAGSSLVGKFGMYDHWLAFGLLGFVGGRMIRSGLKEKGESFEGDPSRGLLLLTLSVATSLDALAVGLSLAMVRVSIWYPSILIGLVTGGLSAVGVRLGRTLGVRFGKKMELLGGVVLVLIGLRILISHLYG